MEDDSVIVVEESKRFEFESLKFTCRIVREIHCRICRAPVREEFKKTAFQLRESIISSYVLAYIPLCIATVQGDKTIDYKVLANK